MSILAPFIALWLFMASIPAFPASLVQPAAPAIWLAPLQPSRPGEPPAGIVDFEQLFKPGAAWAEAAARIAAFKLYPSVAREASDAQLQAIISGLAARHIPLALEGDILIRTSRCDPNPGTGDGIIPAVARLKRLGADLRYFDMNGPLVAGHTYVGRPACHASIDEVAADAANTIRRLRDIYPSLQFGDIEPVGHAPTYPDWAELPAWFAAFKKATGELPAFFHTDITWGLPWRDDLRRIAAMNAASGVPLGVILNGTGHELSDADYAAAVQLHARQVEEALGQLPAQVIFQSWDPYPRHALPDTDPTAMTGYVLDFLRVPARLTSSPVAAPTAPIHARLTDAAGTPVAGAKVVLEAVPASSSDGLVAQSMQGTTPPRTRSALVALRVRDECMCTPDPARLSVAGFSFEGSGQKPFHWNFDAWGQAAPTMITARSERGVPVLTIAVPAGQKLSLNGPRFPVAANAPFDAKFLLHVPPASTGTGFVALIFFGDDGREIHRAIFPLTSTWRPVGQGVTDQHGNVAVATPGALPTGAALRLSYPGDSHYKPTTSNPKQSE